MKADLFEDNNSSQNDTLPRFQVVSSQNNSSVAGGESGSLENENIFVNEASKGTRNEEKNGGNSRKTNQYQSCQNGPNKEKGKSKKETTDKNFFSFQIGEDGDDEKENGRMKKNKGEKSESKQRNSKKRDREPFNQIIEANGHENGHGHGEGDIEVVEREKKHEKKGEKRNKQGEKGRKDENSEGEFMVVAKYNFDPQKV